MARRQSRPEPTAELTLRPLQEQCRVCGQPTWSGYYNTRTVRTLAGVVRLRLQIRRCHDRSCERYRRPQRPEGEGAFVLPDAEVGLDVLALVGTLRYRQSRSVPEIHRELLARGVPVAERTVTQLLYRYEELVTVHVRDPHRLDPLLIAQGKAILSLDGLQPDKGHETLWVVREVLSGEILWAESLASDTQAELARLLSQVKARLPVPIEAVLSDAEIPLRQAVAQVLAGVPHQLCQFHYLREAAKELFAADRHAKVALKKQVGAIRPLERRLDERQDAAAQVVREYCLAVRAAFTEPMASPLASPGLLLHDRLEAIYTSIRRVGKKGGSARN